MANDRVSFENMLRWDESVKPPRPGKPFLLIIIVIVIVCVYISRINFDTVGYLLYPFFGFLPSVTP